MRFLHTADWHIGRKLQQVDLIEDQEFVLNNLVDNLKNFNLDFMIIAGDLYDRTLPNKDAVTLLQKLLVRINIDNNLPIFAISGNHDSRERLAVGKEWFSKYNFYLATKLEDAFNKIEYKDADIYLLPYFEPYEARLYFDDNSLTTHHAATKRVIDEIYKNMDESRINILVAHTFVAGGLPTDSEREISIGTVENVAVDVFSKFDYVALGHLHNPRALNQERIKYSGSPLSYSFSECNQQKGVRLVDLSKTNFKEEFIFLDQKRKMYNIVADYSEIFEKDFLKQFDRENSYFSMELSGLEKITDPMPKIQEFYPNTLVLKRKLLTNEKKNEDINKEVLTKSPKELIENFYKEQMDEELTFSQKQVLEKIIRKVNEYEAD